MEQTKLNKILKWGLVVLMLVSVAILVWGFLVGFTTNDGKATDVLLDWAYVMVALAFIAWVVIGGIASAKSDPKFLLKTGIVVVGLAVVVFLAYLIAPATAATGREGMDTHSTLKLTDTILNLAYFAGVVAVIAIIAGEIRIAINNKK